MSGTSSVVRGEGLEPSTGCPEGILSPLPCPTTQQLSSHSIDAVASFAAKRRELPQLPNTPRHTRRRATSKRPTTRLARAEVLHENKTRKRRAADFMSLLHLCGLVPSGSTVGGAR